MKKILLLGSTGSIGTQVLNVVRQFPGDLQVVGLSTHRNIALVQEQAKEFGVRNVCVIRKHHQDQQGVMTPCSLVNSKKREGDRMSERVCFDSLKKMVEEVDFDLLVVAVVGEVGYQATKKAIEKGKNVALATKEVLVAHGEEIMQLAREKKVEILPIDSEHNAIWQCLRSGKKEEVKKIWLTCSGGPFRDAKRWPKSSFASISKADALKHPSWSMGAKISIDSATLMNKALEFIEAVYLFDLQPEQIEVVIHPESLLHSAVEFVDGSIIGHISPTTMEIPIANVLLYPERKPLQLPEFSLFGKSLHFETVDEERFPSLQFAKKALELGRCKEMNAANEKAVQDFLDEKISFLDIFKRVEKSLL